MLKIIGHIVLVVMLFSGCSMLNPKIPSPCGVTGYIDLPAGTKISSVPLPTDEAKTYTVVTPKPGFWMSLECMGRLDR